jgi:hypothetical protein
MSDGCAAVGAGAVGAHEGASHLFALIGCAPAPHPVGLVGAQGVFEAWLLGWAAGTDGERLVVGASGPGFVFPFREEHVGAVVAAPPVMTLGS